jgi:hypothetical protein
MNRMHAPTRFDVVGPTVDIRGMARRFTEASAEREDAYQRLEEHIQEPVQRPDDWSGPYARAVARYRAGEIDTRLMERTLETGEGPKTRLSTRPEES